jgi:hypothetical protein
MKKTLAILKATPLFAAILIQGCGGGDSGFALVGGTVTGLPAGASVTLQNNGSNLAVAEDGTFEFDAVSSTAPTYSVSVLVQPVGATCSVLNASGSMDSSALEKTSVVVLCESNASLTGIVDGLAPGTSVRLRDGDLVLDVAANGRFAFPGILPVGTPYEVDVETPPAGHACVVENATGFVTANAETNVIVSCD